MEGIMNILQTMVDAYAESELPKMTADTFVNIWNFVSNELIALAKDYIAIIFG